MKTRYKCKDMDFGVRLENVIKLPYTQSVGIVYSAYMFDLGNPTSFPTRLVFVNADTLEKNWVAVEDIEKDGVAEGWF